MQRRTLRGVHFIQVSGNSVERTRGHFTLLRQEALDGAAIALSHKNEWVIRRGPGIAQIRLLQDLVVFIYKKLLLPYLDTRCHREEREALKAAAEVTGLPYELWREGLFQPDAILLLARILLMRYVLPQWIPGGIPGCTSGVALKEWTKNGKLLACRNLDYLVIGPWERHPTVVFNEPTGEGEIPYVTIASAGMQSGGLTSMNREGVTLFTHAHFGRRVSFLGRPIVMIGDELIRKAKTLGQAIDIAKKNRTCANWAFVISSAKENQAAVIEMTPDKVDVRTAEAGWIAHSNFFHSKDLQKTEAILCGSYCEDLEARYGRVKETFQSLKGRLEPSHLSEILGDHTDYFSKQERIIGNTVSVVTTLTSAVFEPESQKFWLSNRHESPVGLGDFIEVDVEKFWKVSAEEYDRKLTTLPPYQPKTPGFTEGMRRYREAYQSYHVNSHEHDYQEKALISLEQAIGVFPQDGHLWIQAGIVSFKARQFEKARTYFEGSRSCPMSEHVQRVRELYLARCYDLSGERDRALEIYQRHLNTSEPRLRKAFKRGFRQPYRVRETRRILVDLQFPDSFWY